MICTQCNVDKPQDKFYYRKDNEAYRKQCKTCWSDRCEQYYASTRDKQLEQRKNNYRQNKKRYHAQSKQWRMAHPERMTSYKRKWKKLNRGKVNAAWMKRNAAKKNATPKWLSKEHFQRIELFYTAAAFFTKFTGVKVEVDHIVPIRGKTVTGLHVPWNLQLLTGADNLKKGNRLYG